MTPDHPGSTLFGDRNRPRPDVRDASILAAYEAVGRTLDDLPYTPDFERIYAAAGADAVWSTRREAFRRLQNLRKAGKLPAVGRAPDAVRVRLTTEDEARLAAMVVELVGTLGQRDQLVYDPRLDALTERFNASTGRALTQHEVWRVIAKLAKVGPPRVGPLGGT